MFDSFTELFYFETNGTVQPFLVNYDHPRIYPGLLTRTVQELSLSMGSALFYKRSQHLLADLPRQQAQM